LELEVFEMRPQENKVYMIPGLHSVKEALLDKRTGIAELWVSEGKDSARVKEILDIADMKDVPVYYKKAYILDNILPGTTHQGIVAMALEYKYLELDELINASLKAPGYALLIVADHITDEGNLGAIIRTAVFFGAHGLVLPKDRSAKITRNVMKRSSGAYVHLPIARVVNLIRALDTLNKKGFWIIGAAGESTDSIYQFDWKRDLALILGSEDRGLSSSVRNKCHQLVGIPAAGSLDALNVSVAAGVILSEIVHQQSNK
jgi:23S rRNA (guanosine2251-2'-O)-methyltransferase